MVTPRVMRVAREHAHVTTAHRARHHRLPSPMSPMRARGSGGGAFSFARLLARAVAEAAGLGEAVAIVGYDARANARAIEQARATSLRARVIMSQHPHALRRWRRSLAHSTADAYVVTPHTARARVV